MREKSGWDGHLPESSRVRDSVISRLFRRVFHQSRIGEGTEKTRLERDYCSWSCSYLIALMALDWLPLSSIDGYRWVGMKKRIKRKKDSGTVPGRSIHLSFLWWNASLHVDISSSLPPGIFWWRVERVDIFSDRECSVSDTLFYLHFFHSSFLLPSNDCSLRRWESLWDRW